VKILPKDPIVADVILRIECNFETMLGALQGQVAHLPSRVRSLIWILSSLPTMAAHGHHVANEWELRAELASRIPALSAAPAEPAGVPV
jgi:DNA polymerase III psi subunit